VEFFSERLEKAGHLPVPFMDGGTENPISFADTIGEGALIGISGERTNRFTHTQFHNIPSLMKGENEGTVDLHPEDARNRNIAAGQWLTISSDREGRGIWWDAMLTPVRRQDGNIPSILSISRNITASRRGE
jgi:thiosulfate reductase / polysulfide reductase chain A